MSNCSGTVVVIDNGSRTCKADFSYKNSPSVIIPSLVGTPNKLCRHVSIKLERRESFVGDEAQSNRGILALTHLFDRHGSISNWEGIQEIWQNVWKKLNCESSDYPVLLTEPPLNALPNRERITQIMFETFDVPAMFLATKTVLSIFATTFKTGVVLYCGHNTAFTVPIYEGHAQDHAIQKLDLAGNELTEYLVRKLADSGHRFRSSAEKDIARVIKEKLCYVAPDYAAELAKDEDATFEMPDGRLISIGSERFHCPEALFNPSLLGRDVVGLHEMVYKSIKSSDLRDHLRVTTVLSGGTTLLPNFSKRLQNEIATLIPADVMQVNVVEPPNRQFAVWIGGSVLASQAKFPEMCITREDYDEIGPRVVQRKCF